MGWIDGIYLFSYLLRSNRLNMARMFWMREVLARSLQWRASCVPAPFGFVQDSFLKAQLFQGGPHPPGYPPLLDNVGRPGSGKRSSGPERFPVPLSIRRSGAHGHARIRGVRTPLNTPRFKTIGRVRSTFLPRGQKGGTPPPSQMNATT